MEVTVVPRTAPASSRQWSQIFCADLARPTVSASFQEDRGTQLLKVAILGPADGSYDLRSGDAIQFVGELQKLSGAAPYIVYWIGVPGAASIGGEPAPGNMLSTSPASVLSMFHVTNAEAASVPFQISSWVSLVAGGHRISLVVRDAEGSFAQHTIVLNVLDSLDEAKGATSVAEQVESLRLTSLTNLSASVHDAHMASEDLSKRQRAQQLEQARIQQDVDKAEALAVAAAADVGALNGKISAFQSIKTEQDARLAYLRSETLNSQRMLEDLGQQKESYENRISASLTNVAAVELLRYAECVL
jgi:hypothetical protein